MSSPPVTSPPDTLPAVLANVFHALNQSREQGVAWSVLAGKTLWINSVQSLGNNLAVHEKLPAPTTHQLFSRPENKEWKAFPQIHSLFLAGHSFMDG